MSRAHDRSDQDEPPELDDDGTGAWATVSRPGRGVRRTMPLRPAERRWLLVASGTSGAALLVSVLLVAAAAARPGGIARHLVFGGPLFLVLVGLGVVVVGGMGALVVLAIAVATASAPGELDDADDGDAGDDRQASEQEPDGDAPARVLQERPAPEVGGAAGAFPAERPPSPSARRRDLTPLDEPPPAWIDAEAPD